mmetsp:Transcript_7497/g.21558  ORF Transcript_7497/g.21558 Transcript_7497/m.21558 type:complete len:322 (-) Transcript_7497:426-1391(-)
MMILASLTAPWGSKRDRKSLFLKLLGRKPTYRFTTTPSSPVAVTSSSDDDSTSTDSGPSSCGGRAAFPRPPSSSCSGGLRLRRRDLSLLSAELPSIVSGLELGTSSTRPFPGALPRPRSFPFLLAFPCSFGPFPSSSRGGASPTAALSSHAAPWDSLLSSPPSPLAKLCLMCNRRFLVSSLSAYRKAPLCWSLRLRIFSCLLFLVFCSSTWATKSAEDMSLAPAVPARLRVKLSLVTTQMSASSTLDTYSSMYSSASGEYTMVIHWLTTVSVGPVEFAASKTARIFTSWKKASSSISMFLDSSILPARNSSLSLGQHPQTL